MAMLIILCFFLFARNNVKISTFYNENQTITKMALRYLCNLLKYKIVAYRSK